jgi:phage-related minor tail protein
MANHQNAATLGVALSLETGSFVAEAQKAAYETQKLKNTITREMKAADKEIQALKYATEDYGKAVTKVAEIERQLESGRLKNIKGTDKAAELLAQAAAYDKIAASQKKITGELTQQQKMALTYQTTDLFTQIASGQSPMIAIIQQGGQLKDAMGGIKGMFTAIGTLLTPFNLALGGTATVLGSLGLAFYQGSEESKKFHNSLILTGGFAGIIEERFNGLSRVISDKFNIGIGDARDVLQGLVSSGNFTYKSLDAVAGVVARVASLSGDGASVVAEKLIPALDGSASSAKKLNDTYHFLTLEQYKNIEALNQQGKTQEAVKLTADLLTESLAGQSAKLGYLEKMWKATKIAASDFWDWMKEIGREEDPSIAAMKDQARLMESYVRLGGEGAIKGVRYQAALSEYKRLAELIDQQEKEAKAKSDKKAKDDLKITDYSATGGADRTRQLAMQEAKIRQDAFYEAAKTTATEEERIRLEAEQKIAAKKFDFDAISAQERRARGVELERVLNAEIESIRAERDRKISDERYKQYRKELDLQIAAMQHEEAFQAERDKAQDAYVQKNWLAYKSVEEIQKAERETLNFKMETFGYTQREIDLKKVDIQLEREKAMIKANSAGQKESDIAEAYRLAEATAAQKRETVELADVYRKIDVTFQSVWGNLSSVIDNFVKTGKANMKEFARSVIQDLIAIQMKAAAMKFLGGAFDMFKGGLGGGGGTSMSQFEYAMVSGFADGGDPPVNQVSVVGERGPELFIPKTAGTIIPNNALGNLGGNSGPVFNGPYIANMSAIDTQSAMQFLARNKQAVWSANQSAQRSMPVSR